MNSKGKFALVIVAMLIVVLVIEYRMPRRFEWTPTFSHTDSQPFGCQVFDSILTTTMPNGYAVNKQTLWQMEHDSTLSTPHGIVILTNESMDYDDVSAILSLAEEGHVVLVAATRGLYLWEDTMDIDYSWNSEFRIKNIAGQVAEKKYVRWVGEGNYPLGDTICCVYDQMVSCTIRDLGDSSKVVPLADYDESWWYDDGEEREWSAIAVSIPRGKGEVILVSAPLLMTNYAILNHDNGAVLIHRMMDRMKHLPVIRTESYMSATAQAEESPFYVFLHEPPLRWALYITMLSILLFCIFTARRRQRPIPVFPKQENGNLEFVRLIGTLYWQEGNHQDLLAKKLAYTAEDIRRQTGIDISGDSGVPGQPVQLDIAQMGQLSRLTGIDRQELQFILNSVHSALAPNYPVTVHELKSLIAELDRIHDSL